LLSQPITKIEKTYFLINSKTQKNIPPKVLSKISGASFPKFWMTDFFAVPYEDYTKERIRSSIPKIREVPRIGSLSCELYCDVSTYC
jgi:hypothetical protein